MKTNLILQFAICYCFRNAIRTNSPKKSKPLVISSLYVNQALKTSLFGIMALVVLSVSVNSAFVESAYANEHDPIKTVLDITYQNILESRADAGEISDNAETFFTAGEAKYNEAIAALEAGDTAAARENALIAMALFESSAEEI